MNLRKIFIDYRLAGESTQSGRNSGQCSQMTTNAGSNSSADDGC